MKKLFTILFLFTSLLTFSQTHYAMLSNNGDNITTDMYIQNYPTNSIGNRWATMRFIDSNEITFYPGTVRFLRLSSNRHAFDTDSISGFVYTTPHGVLRFGNFNRLLLKSDSSLYSTKSFVQNNYQPIGSYLTSEVDGSTTNELQILGLAGRVLSITLGNSVTFPRPNYDSLDNVPSTFPPSSHTHPQNQVIGLPDSLLKKMDVPTGTIAQYVRGNGTLTTFPTNVSTFTNDAGYLTAEVDGSVTNEIEVASQTGNSGKFLTTNGTVTSWVNAVTGSEIDSIKTRIFDTSFRTDLNKRTTVRYSVEISCALSLTGGQAGYVYLETSSDNSNWTTQAQLRNSNTGTLTIGLNTLQIYGGLLVCDVKAGEYVRLRTSSTVGSPTFTYIMGHEIHKW